MRSLKKLLIGSTATLALGAALLATPQDAQAGVSVGIGIGLPFPGVVFGAPLPPPVVVGPPVVYGPPPVVYGPPAYWGPRYGRAVYARYPVRNRHRDHRCHHARWD